MLAIDQEFVARSVDGISSPDPESKIGRAAESHAAMRRIVRYRSQIYRQILRDGKSEELAEKPAVRAKEGSESQVDSEISVESAESSDSSIDESEAVPSCAIGKCLEILMICFSWFLA